MNTKNLRDNSVLRSSNFPSLPHPFPLCEKCNCGELFSCFACPVIFFSNRAGAKFVS